MNVQLQQFGIYSKDLKEHKFISFQKGKLNIIHGASQTGKSAIIPIMIIVYVLLIIEFQKEKYQIVVVHMP